MADNQATLESLKQLSAQNARWQSSLAVSEARDAQDRRVARTIRRNIDAAPPNADGPVAPVLIGALRSIAVAQGQKVLP